MQRGHFLLRTHTVRALATCRSVALSAADRELMSRISKAPSAPALIVSVKRHLGSFDAVHVCTCLRRLVHLKESLRPQAAKGPHVAALVSRLKRDLAKGETDAFGAASAAWAAASIGDQVPALLDALPDIIAACTRLAPDMSSQGLSTAAWALASLELHPSDARPSMDALIAHSKLSRLGPQDLAFTAWACASLAYQHRPFVEAISHEVVQKIDLFSPKALANLAWAFATVGVYNQPLMVGIASTARRRITDFAPDDLANIASSFVLWNRRLKLSRSMQRSFWMK